MDATTGGERCAADTACSVACAYPLKAYRAPGGRIVFKVKDGYIDRPLDIPCGQCFTCKMGKAQAWATRCYHESQMHSKNSFITLTYNDEHLPLGWTLVLKHWQDFAKRARKEFGSFRFYHCGEYGDRFGRPHYHALIFGDNFEEDRKPYGDSYRSKRLDDNWGKGFVDILDLTPRLANYCSRYIMKKVSGDNAEEHYEGTKPEYSTMSRNPGIGKSWIEKYYTDIYPADFIVVQGKKRKIPTYYDEFYAGIEPEKFEAVKAQRIKEAAKHKDNQTPERLIVRDKVARAWGTLQKRDKY